MQPATTPVDLTELVRLKDYRASRSTLFPSEYALDWHWRQHKARYAHEGAVLMICNRVYVRPQRFDEVFAAIAVGEAVSKLASPKPAAA